MREVLDDFFKSMPTVWQVILVIVIYEAIAETLKRIL